MHVASLSKIVTAIAMTRLLGETGIPPSAPIIDYLPGYWVKGPNVDRITFAELMTHSVPEFLPRSPAASPELALRIR